MKNAQRASLSTLAAAALAMAAALSACSPSAPDDGDQHLLEGHQRALEKAREVEGEVQDAFERQRQAIEEQSGPADPNRDSG